MRFKPPPACSPIGWRVEFRPTEVQLTDFENAAFVVFVVLMTRVILSFRLNLLLPISKVDDNMKVAQKRDAVNSESFYFRKDIVTEETPPQAEECCQCVWNCSPEKVYTKLTINDIINGKPDEFPGLIPLINSYLESVDDIDVDTGCTISQYLKFISMKASGKLMTTARWIREFVTTHPEYKQDSVVSDDINYDLMMKCEAVTSGKLQPPELLIPYNTKSSDDIPKAMQKAEIFLDGKSNLVNGL